MEPLFLVTVAFTIPLSSVQELPLSITITGAACKGSAIATIEKASHTSRDCEGAVLNPATAILIRRCIDFHVDDLQIRVPVTQREQDPALSHPSHETRTSTRHVCPAQGPCVISPTRSTPAIGDFTSDATAFTRFSRSFECSGHRSSVAAQPKGTSIKSGCRACSLVTFSRENVSAQITIAIRPNSVFTTPISSGLPCE